MVGKAKSATQKAHEATQQKDSLYTKATDIYLAKQQKPPGQEWKGLRTVCTEVSDEHFAQTHHRIQLSSTTLGRLVKGGKLRSESNAERSWITPEETETIITFAVEMAQRGFPLTRGQLTEHANLILRARLGGNFPPTGVGKNWADHFIIKHSDHIKVYLSRPLDMKHAHAVNSTVNTAWFDLLGKYIEKYDIQPECLFGSDESGFMLGSFFCK
ncbi:hypothetical protein M0805_009689, partial [Coniferiporia weirii]